MDEAIVILLLILMLVIIPIAVTSNIENNDCIYECVDYNGNIVYCTDAYVSKAGMFGILEDGTKTTLRSYKKVLKEGGYVNGL